MGLGKRYSVVSREKRDDGIDSAKRAVWIIGVRQPGMRHIAKPLNWQRHPLQTHRTMSGIAKPIDENEAALDTIFMLFIPTSRQIGGGSRGRVEWTRNGPTLDKFFSRRDLE